MTQRKSRKPRPPRPWELTCDLFYGGVQVGKVFSFDKCRDCANVFLQYSPQTGTDGGWLPVAKITGRWRRGAEPRAMSDEEIRDILQRMAGIVF